ncbi:MAG: adenylyltransferase/cytidyltransferase family protein [Candidatus Onthomorpha sp.]|nr:adenylyltransferase/cytidyltransferase family protein [Bacteroidales bacterium]MDY5699344.1 adenylyltransferase/cytidyltransferase family protein [Candidatus Onthomorpha sp.]
MAKKVFVSGCYDLLHSGHVEFFRQAAEYGDLYVGIGSDKTILNYKNHKTVYSEQERLFMVKSIKYVRDAYINSGDGILDFIPTLDIVKPDILVVNSDGGSDSKRRLCEERGIEYVVLERDPHEGLQARSSTELKKSPCKIPTRIDLAGTWIDQPYVSCFAPGWAITLSIEPSFEIRNRCGLSTSTRNVIRRIWPYQLPNMDPETLARLVFCFENHPEREDGIISGAQDAIGICVPGLCRHYYDNHFWPEKIERCEDERILNWLEKHLCMIPMEPRKAGCSVVEGKDITTEKVKNLTFAADECWEGIMNMDLNTFVSGFRKSFDAQVAMFPAMIQGSVQSYIDKYSSIDDVLAWKMPGAGGGGYLVCVVNDASLFCTSHSEAIPLKVRRSGM